MTYRAKNSREDWFSDSNTHKPFEEISIETLASRIAYHNKRCKAKLYNKKGGKWIDSNPKDQIQFEELLDRQFFYQENKK